MALYTPVDTKEKALEYCHILQTKENDGFTLYVIEVRLLQYFWHIPRRYKQFVDLHEKMVNECNIDKNLLPPKKLFGNKTETFINERKKALELYLCSLIQKFSLLPEPLALFLDFQNYEVRTITAVLSEIFYSKGEEILSKGASYEFSPLQLHAMSEHLKLGNPSYTKNPKQDVAHLVDFITQLKHLVIKGSSLCFGKSNIVPNDLSYDLCLFKNLDTLEIFNCKLTHTISSVDVLRIKLKSLTIHKTLEDISDILLCGILHWCPITDPIQSWPYWNCITFVNFSHNQIREIHASIKLLLSVKHIDFSHNEIKVIENMESLSELSVLILSHNQIKETDSLHTRLGNIHSLNLSSNKIKNLKGFCKLYSVSKLFLENNSISSLEEIVYLSKLPCLEILNLQHNPVNLIVDYRPQVLLLLSPLAYDLVLDGVKATEKEKDTVSILQALKQARCDNSSSMKQNASMENSNSNNISATTPEYQTENSPGANASKQIYNNLNQSSKFRHQVETLRKIGGSDWLHLLNEIHKSKVETNVVLNNTSCENQHLNRKCLNDENTNKKVENNLELNSQLIETLTNSYTISFPDWLLCFDTSSLKLEKILPIIFFNKNNFEMLSNDYLAFVKNARVLWGTLLKSDNNLVYDIPLCILITCQEIILLQLKKILKCQTDEKNLNNEYNPEFSYLKSVLHHEVISFSIGSCNAYIELSIKKEDDSENIVLLMNDENTNIFSSEMYHLYNITPLYKFNPFAKKMLELETLKVNFSLSQIFVQKQILFAQHVCVSKITHKCKYKFLHYVIITPSHVVLIEEKLLSDSMKPNTDMSNNLSFFQVCSIIDVHSNVKQIHLKDINYEFAPVSRLCNWTEENKKANVEDTNLDFFYKYGFWLIIEFDFNHLFCLKFLALEQRNQFLDIFLCVRKEKY